MIRRIPAAVLASYRAVSFAVQPLVPFYLEKRVERGKEDPARLRERFGEPSLERPAGPLIWLHAASVGEMLAVLPLISRLRGRGYAALLTSGTVTSAQLAERRLPAGVLHQYVPLDIAAFVRRFLDHWRPDLALLAESELWPNLIVETTRRGVPVILVNGRMSSASFGRWRRLRPISSALLSRIDLCLAQGQGDAERFLALGAPRVVQSGNLKFDTPPPPADKQHYRALADRLEGRPLLLAASTHRGEEAAVLDAHGQLKGRFRRLTTVIVPRHPERGGEVADVALARGLVPVMRSRGHLPDVGTEVYIADTIGELGLFYRLCPVVFMGGSLVKHGGQNPIEPAKLECAILHGPHVSNFAEIYAALNRAHAAATVTDGVSLTKSVAVLLEDPATMQRMAIAARDTVAEFTGALEKTLAALDPYLIQLRLAGA